MGPLFLALQLAGGAPAAPSPAADTLPPPGYAPGPAPSPYAQPGYGPPPYGAPPYGAPPPPYGYGPGYGYAPYGYAPPPKPKPSVPDRPVHVYGRLSLGLGPPAFSDETRLLHLEGYGGAKIWVTLDGAYFVHPNIGLGAFAAVGTWSSSAGSSSRMSELSLFVGGQVPIKFGTRSFAFVGAPRLGFGTGQLDLGGSTSFQSALALGLDLGVVSFKYHLGGSIGFLRAAVPPPGEVGRNHDYGGLYVTIGGTFDG